MSLDNKTKEEMRTVKEDISKKVDEKIAKMSFEEQNFEDRFVQMQKEKEMQREQIREKKGRMDTETGRKRGSWRKRFDVEEPDVWGEIHEAVQEMEVPESKKKQRVKDTSPAEPILVEEDHAVMKELDAIAKEMEKEQAAFRKVTEPVKKEEEPLLYHSDEAQITWKTRAVGLTFEKKCTILRDEYLHRRSVRVRRHRRKIQVSERRFALRMADRVERFDRMINVVMKRKIVRTLKHIWNKGMDILDWCEDHKVILAEVLALALFCIAACTTFLGHITAYEYSYNGKALGIVKTKEEVYKTIDAIGDKLGTTLHARVEIDKEKDITFREVRGLNLPLDSKDEVLNNLTYMQDVKVVASAIYKDDELIGIVQNENIAMGILEDIKDNFTQQKENESRVFDQVSFAEDVEIRNISVNLGEIENEADVLEYMLTGAVEKKIHSVKSGETFSGIAKKYGLKQSELESMNPGITPSKLKIGQEIILNRDAPVLTVQTTETVTYTEAIPYDTIYEESSSMYEGETSTKKKGVNGTQEVVARVMRNNDEEISRVVLSTKTLEEPESAIVVKGTKKAPPRQGTGTWAWPIKNYRISSKFGWRWGRMHNGIDLAASTGTKIYATDGGTVTYAGYKGTFGYLVIIDHGGNYESYYAHCSKLLVKKGDKVFQGQNIALVGNTGRSTGPHLHFEIRYLGTPKDPLDYI